MLRFDRNTGPRLAAAFAFAAVLLAVLAGRAPALRAEGTVDGFRAKMEKWVETRRILSEEKSEWEADQESLQLTRKLLREQKKGLEADIKALEESSTVADDERNELLLERGAVQRASAVLEEQIGAMERQVLDLAPRLPEPLRDKLELLLVQIPKDPAATDLELGRRLMNVLGVLAQAEKFNGTATFVGETRAVADEQRVQVRTLYWGVGQAIYVDAQGRSAGIGRPSANGWEFSNDPDLADDAAALLDIYEGNTDAIDFVKLPVEIR